MWARQLLKPRGPLLLSPRKPGVRARAVPCSGVGGSFSRSKYPHPFRPPFRPLRHGAFRAVWLAFLIANLGGLIQSVGAAWLMTSLTGSAGLVALVQASTALPIMLFSLAAGAIADNYDKRAVS